VKVLRYGSPNWTTGLNVNILPDTNVTIMHLGRGGVMEDGTLDLYNTQRVLQTVVVASVIVDLRPPVSRIQILWTGGHNRKADRSGAQRPASEAGAAYQYAAKVTDDSLTMLTEEDSTSTVENATRSAGLVPDGDVIVVVTDPLHYLAWKVQFIMWLAFPGHRLIFVELPAAPPDTNWKSKVKHLVSTFITVTGMIGVTRGDAAAIQRRQNQLQRLTGH
jgi:hypothetical protein